MFLCKQVEGRHKVDPGDRVDHLKAKQHALRPYFPVMAVVLIDGWTQAQIQAEDLINDLYTRSDEMPERAFQETADVVRCEPVCGPPYSGAQQILRKLRRMERAGARRKIALV